MKPTPTGAKSPLCSTRACRPDAVQCASCGGDLERGQTSCDFCGTSCGALAEGSGASVPVAHLLGQELGEGKTFDDSQREIGAAMQRAEHAEQRRTSASRTLRTLLFAAIAILVPYGLYTLIFVMGWAEGALNGGVFSAQNNNYVQADQEFRAARRLLPRAAEPLYLQGGLVYLRLCRSPEAGDSLYRAARLREARELLKQCLERKASYAPAEFYLGLIAWGDKHQEEAVLHWKRCVDILQAKSGKSAAESKMLTAAQQLLTESRGAAISLSGVPPALGGSAANGGDGVPYGRCP